MGKYRGTENKSSRKVTCKDWSSLGGFNKFHPSKQPDADLDSNYCRNPDEDVMGPWCFISLSPRKFQYCRIPLCTNANPFLSRLKMVAPESQTIKSSQKYRRPKQTTRKYIPITRRKTTTKTITTTSTTTSTSTTTTSTTTT